LFTLVVDDFGVKYVGKEHANHLIACITKSKYKLTEDWKGNLYCGITLDWNYKKKYVNVSMPGYIKKKLHKYGHAHPTRMQTCPYSPEQKNIGCKSTTPPAVQQFQTTGQERNTQSPKNRWQYPVLCTGGRQHSIDWIKLHRRRTNKSNGENSL
jgi:hypothetical protein